MDEYEKVCYFNLCDFWVVVVVVVVMNMCIYDPGEAVGWWREL